MITRFFSREELNLDIPEPVGGKYVGELRREDFVKIPEPVQEVPDNIFLQDLGLCCFGEEYVDISV
jgi:hypothetical protein